MSAFARVLAEIEAAGPAGIRTDVLAQRIGCSQDMLKCDLKRHRERGEYVRCLLNGCTPARVFGRREWYEAAEKLQDAAVRARRNKEKRAARAKLSAARAEKKANVVVVQAVKATAYTGALPRPEKLPWQPVYSRHQIAELPAGYRSVLDPRDCRPWAACVGAT